MTLTLDTVMSHDVGSIVMRHLASTQESARVCRSVSSECRQLVDSTVHSLRANLKSLSSHSCCSCCGSSCSSDDDDVDTAAQQQHHSTGLPLRFPQLQRLSFDRSSASESSRLLLELAAQQPQLLAALKELDLTSCQGLEADALSALLQAACCLRSLTLPPLSACVTSSKEELLRAISTHGQQLQHLRGVGDYLADGSSLDTGLQHIGRLTALQTLDLSTERHALHIPPRSLQQALQASRPSLRSLRLGNNLACHDTFELAASMPALQCLEFVYVCDVRDALRVEDLSPLRHSSSLRRLALCGLPCSDGLLQLLAGCRAVTELSISAAPFTATPQGAACMAGRLLQLQLGANDSTCDALAAALPVLGIGLTSLSLSIHRAAADYRRLLQAVFGLPALQQLTLGSHYHGLTKSELQDLPVAPQLLSLSLHNHFSDATLGCVLRSTPGVKHLTLSSCGGVGLLGLECVLQHCSGLREVTLQLMRGVDAAGVAALACGPRVTRVVLEGCRNVSGEECQELTRALHRPELDIVKLR